MSPDDQAALAFPHLPQAGTLDRACWDALKAKGCGPLLVDLRLHPEDVMTLRCAHQGGDNSRNRITWDGPSDAHGGFRYCGFRVLPDRSVPLGSPIVVAKPD